MMTDFSSHSLKPLARRTILRGAALAAAGLAATRHVGAANTATVTLPFANGVREVLPAGSFPEKGEMILQRMRAPLLESPWSALANSVFTPNDQFYVRWHFADFPNHVEVDPRKFRLRIFGEVQQPIEISLSDLVQHFPAVEIAAVNQCSGNSRGFVTPRVPGAQWGHGAMGNALWAGVPLRSLLAKAGPKPGATHVAFRSLEDRESPFPPPLHFEKVLALPHANDGEVMIAYAMNGDTLPLLNGFPLRLIVPGWYATYWVKMLSEIEVTNHPGAGFWMATAYKVPDRPNGAMQPGEANVPMVPIAAMTPRSFFANPDNGARIAAGQASEVRGFAFGGSAALSEVSISADDGKTWRPVELGKDFGTYSFRQWRYRFTPGTPGRHRLMVRAGNARGEQQPLQAGWNPGGFMFNPVEQLALVAV